MRTLGGIRSQRKLEVAVSLLATSSLFFTPHELFFTVCMVYSISVQVDGHLQMCSAQMGHLKSSRHSNPAGLQLGPSTYG